MKSILFAALLLISGPALACDELVPIDKVQARELLSTVKNEQADQLDRIFAFETLFCAKELVLRDLALRTAAETDVPSLKVQVLASVLMELNIVSVDFVPLEGLGKELYDFIQTTPSMNFQVAFADPKELCLSLNPNARTECYTSDLLQISGLQVDINADEGRIVGRFSYDGGDSLKGDLDVNDSNGKRLTLPSAISLF